jgi:membrane protease YdiL (CAAX protease family)
VLALLFIVWGYGLYDGHLGEASTLPLEDTEQASLRFLDRTLSLSDSFGQQPAAFHWLTGIDGLPETLEFAGEGLESLKEKNALTEEGETALAVVLLELGKDLPDDLEPNPAVMMLRDGEPLGETWPADLADYLTHDQAPWWYAWMARKTLEQTPDAALEQALRRWEMRTHPPLVRALMTSAVLWLFSLFCLSQIPAAWRLLRAGWPETRLARPARIASKWKPSVVIGVFLAADLAGGGFIIIAYEAVANVDTGFGFDVAVDLLWRFLPILLMAAILFRRPRHVTRSLGLGRRIEWRVVFGMYALLVLAEVALLELYGRWAPVDPTGGLELMEDGWPGLAYGLLSACVAAPVAEEIFYRGLLLRGLQGSLRFPAALAISTMVFAIAHFYDFYGLISVGIFGASAAVVYRATGSLTTAIVLHALYNLTITVPQWLVFHTAW